MLFYSFKNQDERRKYGSAFMELQYCTLNSKTELKKIVKLHGCWVDSSLYIYIDDIGSFCSIYGEIFYGGTYANLLNGKIDIYGVNYYSPEQLTEIIDKIEEQKPLHCEVLLEWLKKGLEYNGFYILGI